MAMTDIIELPFRGRDIKESEGEFTIRTILCNPEIHNHMAAIRYCDLKNLGCGQIEEEFAKLSPMEQEIWRDELIKEMEQFNAMTPAEQTWYNRVGLRRVVKIHDKQ
jgi:hypothetical protein